MLQFLKTEKAEHVL